MSLRRYAEWLRGAWDDPAAALDRDPCPDGRSGPHRRLVRALAQRWAGRPLGPADLVALVRAVARQEAIGQVSVGLLEVPAALVASAGVGERDWEDASVTAAPIAAAVRVSAAPWQPAWLNPREPVDATLYEQIPRHRDRLAPPDPFLPRLGGYPAYQSEAQREAVRAVLTAPAGATLVLDLPTSSGKTLCGLMPALRPLPDAPDQLGVTPFIVPTVALALDLERRVRRDDPNYRSAYRPDEPEAAALVRQRCEAGLQGPVFVSPESLVGSLRPALRAAARKGLLRALVVDEAHMVSAWGDEFRPAFQQIAAVRRELLRQAEEAGAPLALTILMSATLTEPRLRQLADLFGAPGPIRYVHAVRLRPEPSYWLAQATDEQAREVWLLEAVRHLPRPLILYTVKRAHAEAWARRLREAGFTRVGLMHGGTEHHARRALLDAWNHDRTDVVVATSAFGLGVDKSDVRAVLHAALPEGVDRLYQEVGRGGRDGRASMSLLVWSPRDWGTATALMGPTLIGEERGLERWEAMFREKAPAGPPGRYRVSLATRPSLRPGDIDMDNEEHRKWNLRTLLLLARAGVLDLHWEDDGTGPAPGAPVDAERSLPDQVTVQLRVSDHLEAATWARLVEPARDRILEPAQLMGEQLRRFLNGHECVAKVLHDCYRSEDPEVPVVLACGGCAYCRAHGTEPYAGGLRCRHTPDSPWPPLSLGRALAEWLGGRRCGLVFYRRDEEELTPVLVWLLEQGAVHLTAGAGRVEALGPWLDRHPAALTFLNGFPPRGVLARQVAAVVVGGPGDPDLASVWPELERRDGVTVLLLPDDSRQPDHPARLLAAMWTGPRLTVERWEEVYRE